MGRLEDAQSARRPDQIDPAEDVQERQAIGDRADAFNVETARDADVGTHRQPLHRSELDESLATLRGPSAVIRKRQILPRNIKDLMRRIEQPFTRPKISKMKQGQLSARDLRLAKVSASQSLGHFANNFLDVASGHYDRIEAFLFC
jgi:hypothetical protein